MIKRNSTEELIGCSMEYFVSYIESKFADGMTWENYGKKWNIDHIKPCVAFNLLIFNEQKDCFNYKNLMPVWCFDNLQKGSFYNGNYIRKNRETL